MLKKDKNSETALYKELENLKPDNSNSEDQNINALKRVVEKYFHPSNYKDKKTVGEIKKQAVDLYRSIFK